MASGKSDAHRIFGAIDSLLANHKPRPVLEITESMIRNEPQNWEALYRQGLALKDLDKHAEAAQRFEMLLQLNVGDDEKSAIAKSKSRDPKLNAATARPSASRLLSPVLSTGAVSQRDGTRGLRCSNSDAN